MKLLPALLLALSLGAHAPAPQDAVAPTTDDVDSLRTELSSATGLSDEVKASVTKLLDEAAKALEDRKAALASATDFRQKTAEAPELRATVTQDLARPAEEGIAVPAQGAKLQDLETGLAQVQADLEVAKGREADLAHEADMRAQRQLALPDELARARQAQSEADEAARASLPAAGADLPTRARSVRDRCVQALATARVGALEAERDFLDARRDLLPLRRQRANRRVTALQQAAKTWQMRTEEARQAEAARATEEAAAKRRETARNYPALEELARRNEELALLRSGPEGVSARLSDVQQRQSQRDAELAQVRGRYETTLDKVATAGLAQTLGVVLRRELERLPVPGELAREERDLKRHIASDQLLSLELQEEKDALVSVDGELAALRSELEAGGQEMTPELTSLARELLERRKELNEPLSNELSTLIEHEYRLSTTLAQLTAVSSSFREFIAERILWVPSVGGARLPSAPTVTRTIGWAFDATAWTKAWRQAFAEATARPVVPLAYALAILVLLLRRRPMRRAITTAADGCRSYRTDSYGLTVRTLLASIGLALPLPLSCLGLSSLLLAPGDQPGVAVAVGEALGRVAFLLGALLLLAQVVRPRGLGEAHLRWPGKAVRHLRLHFLWFAPVASFAVLLVRTLAHPVSELGEGTPLERYALVAGMASLAVFLFLAMRPGSATFTEVFRRAPEGLLARTRLLWFGLAILMPTGIACMSAAGYDYGAQQLARLLADSLVLVAVIVLGYGLLLRWLYVERRRILVEQARQRARARLEEEGEEDAAATPIDEDAIDVESIDAQTRRLFRTAALGALLFGLYLTWASALPALKVLDRVELWPQLRVVEDTANLPDLQSLGIAPGQATAPQPAAGAAASGDSSSASTTPPSDTPVLSGPTPGMSPTLSAPSTGGGGSSSSGVPEVVTLADLLGALLALVVMTAAARNLPGLLEIALLKRLPVDAGSRYAISALVRYAIVILGSTIALGTLGIGWSKVQWLAAALTFGLGFGLQEIFANFVSGLIILLERPVRVGDIVTVSGIEGRVTQIRMRSTTITDWDRRELLVPNREFITNSLINWTLSDPITRMVIPVGIAYGSDVRKARGLLMKCAQASPNVLEDPRPSAIFRNFGDSTLDFELRVFFANRDQWPALVDDLHQRIDDAFRKAGVEIAFPQRDLHVRSIGPLEGALRERGGSRQDQGADAGAAPGVDPA